MHRLGRGRNLSCRVLLRSILLAVILASAYSIQARADFIFKPSGGETQKPDDSQPAEPVVKIDAVYHIRQATHYNAFAQGKCTGYAEADFSSANVTLEFASSQGYEDNLRSSYDDDDLVDLWCFAHARWLDSSAFVYSCREHVLGVFGRTIGGPSSPGAQMYFQFQHITFLAYRPMSFYPEDLSSVWGYVLTHELGHLIAGLRHVADSAADHNSSLCVMHQLAVQTDDRKRELLGNFLFCEQCKDYIKQATSQ